MQPGEEIESLVDELEQIVSEAKSPLTGGGQKKIVDAQDVYEILDEIRRVFPQEFTDARRIVKEEQETLDRYTAVSHQTAREMAVGSLELYQSDIAVSATGYAGPGGGTEDDPAGTFYIGWAHRSADGGVPVVDSVRCHYEGDRSCVRAHAVTEALGRIALVLNSME